MKRVLLITDEESHRLLYGRGLAKHFQLEFASSTSGGYGDIDAVVYDVPKYPKKEDYHWLEELRVPIVVLTPEMGLPLPKAEKQCVLAYPARMNDILKALAKLGACS